MQTDHMILAEEFCMHHQIELSFINDLNKSGLIEITEMEQKIFLPASEITNLEKWARLHYDMDINVEGIETISHLLDQMHVMQQHILHLKNRLGFYEPE